MRPNFQGKSQTVRPYVSHRPIFFLFLPFFFLLPSLFLSSFCFSFLLPSVLNNRFTIVEVQLYGDVVLRYVSYKDPAQLYDPNPDSWFLPGFEPVPSTFPLDFGLRRLDHAVGNVSDLNVTFHGRFDILSISATFLPQTTVSGPIPNGFTISLAGPQGQIVGGLVAGKDLSLEKRDSRWVGRTKSVKSEQLMEKEEGSEGKRREETEGKREGTEVKEEGRRK